MNELKTISHSKAGELLALLALAPAAGETKQIDITVRLSGTVTRGEDYESAATVRALSLATVGCILRHCGVTRETAIAAAIKHLQDVKAVEAATGKEFKPDDRDKAFADMFKAEVAAKLPPMACDGKRTGALAVETVSAPIVGQASVELARELYGASDSDIRGRATGVQPI